MNRNGGGANIDAEREETENGPENIPEISSQQASNSNDLQDQSNESETQKSRGGKRGRRSSDSNGSRKKNSANLLQPIRNSTRQRTLNPAIFNLDHVSL